MKSIESHTQFFANTQEYFIKSGLPSGDYNIDDVSTNGKEFDAGGHYGIELSSVNNVKILKEVINLAKKNNIKIARVDECRGIFRLPDNEIKEMAHICATEKIGLILSIGPRATNDIGGFSKSNNGSRIGYRLRGLNSVIYAVEDIKRAINFGVRGFLIYDEGLLFLLNQMRSEGFLPKNLIFKFSVHACCSNPLSAKLLGQIGANTINIIPDLDVCMIKTFRKFVTMPLDVFTDTAQEAGGFIRTYDIPDIIHYASPVYLKCGAVSQKFQNHLPSYDELEERLKQTKMVAECIERYLPTAKKVNENEKTLAIPLER